MRLTKKTSCLHKPLWWLCSMLVLAASCIVDQSDFLSGNGQEDGKEKQVTINLSLPAPTVPSTRIAAGKTNGETVEDLYVLAFGAPDEFIDGKAKEPFLYGTTATQVDATTGQWTATLKTSATAQSFVMIANVGQHADLKKQLEQIISDETSLGKEKTELLGQLAISCEKITSDTSLPMTGQSPASLIKTDMPAQISVTLHRMMARFNLLFGESNKGIEGFELQGIQFMNAHSTGRVVPGELSKGFTSAITTPTLPDSDGDGLYDTPQDIDYEKDQLFYLFEAGQPEYYPTEVSNGKSPDLYRPAIIVKGTWKGVKDRYWRISLKRDETFLNILRNFNYTITVSQILKQGAASAEEAMLTPEEVTFVKLEMEASDEITHIAYDGEKFLGVEKGEITVGKQEVEGTIDVVAYKGLNWTATLYNEGGEGNPDWIYFDKDGTKSVVEGTGAGKATHHQQPFYVKAFDGTVERKALMRFTAGKLMVDVTVTQTDKTVLLLEADAGKWLEYKEDGAIRISVPVTFGPAGATLKWRMASNGLKKQNNTYQGTYNYADTQGTITLGKTVGTDGAGAENYWTAQTYQPANPFVSQNGLIELVAELEGESKVIYVPMKQIKHTLEQKGTKMFTPDRAPGTATQYPLLEPNGDGYKIQVRSTFDWSVSVNESYQQAYDKFINNLTNTKGDKVSEFNSKYAYDIETKAAGNPDGPAVIGMDFVSTSPDYQNENQLKVQDYVYVAETKNITQGDCNYIVYGPFEASLYDLLQGNHPKDRPAGTFLPNWNLAAALFNKYVEKTLAEDKAAGKYGWVKKTVNAQKYGHYLSKVPYTFTQFFAQPSKDNARMHTGLGYYETPFGLEGTGECAPISPKYYVDGVEVARIDFSIDSKTAALTFKLPNPYDNYWGPKTPCPNFHFFYRFPAYGKFDDNDETEYNFYLIPVMTDNSDKPNDWLKCFWVSTTSWHDANVGNPSVGVYFMQGYGSGDPLMRTEFGVSSGAGNNAEAPATYPTGAYGNPAYFRNQKVSWYTSTVTNAFVIAGAMATSSSGAQQVGINAKVYSSFNGTVRPDVGMDLYSARVKALEFTKRTYFKNVFYLKCTTHPDGNCPGGN